MANGDGTPKAGDKGQQSTPVVSQQQQDGTPKTYTQEQVDQLIQANDSRVGRDLKTAKETITTLSGQITKITTDRKTDLDRIESLETEKIKDDPARLSAYHERRAARDLADTTAAKEADIATRETNVIAREKEIATSERNAIVKTFTDLGVSADLIKNFDAIPNENLTNVLQTLVPQDADASKKKVVIGIKQVDSNRSKGGENASGLDSLAKISKGLKDRSNK